MRTIGRYLRRFLILLVLGGGALWLFGPYEQISIVPTIQEADVRGDVTAYFAEREAQFDDITQGVEKRVLWAGSAGDKTDVAVVYVHGFSATSEEIRPVPDMVAEALEANLIFTRLAGHGRDGGALAAATIQDWANDFAEAMIVARKVADEVVVIATSTGGTVVAAMADQPEVMAGVKGVVFVSPNFELFAPTAKLLAWPAARHWIPLLVGESRSFDAQNEAHGTFWTTAYPTVAVMQMAALVTYVQGQDLSKATVPALFMFSDSDVVVKPEATRAASARWGGPVELAPQVLQEGSDPNAHVISGTILSPAEVSGDFSEIFKFINSL